MNTRTLKARGKLKSHGILKSQGTLKSHGILKSQGTLKEQNIFKSPQILKTLKMCKKKKTLKKKDIPTICHDILRIILVTPHDHIGSEETKIKLIQNNFTKAQVQDVLKSKTVIVIRPIPNYKDYEVFLKYVINSILLNRPLPIF